MPYSPDDKISAVAGYAGAKRVGPGGLVCYIGAQVYTIYEGLGYAQVVQVTLRAKENPQFYDPQNEKNEFRALMDNFFAAGAATTPGYQYRSCIGLPGGMLSPLYRIVQQANVRNMNLVVGQGEDPAVANLVRSTYNVVLSDTSIWYHLFIDFVINRSLLRSHQLIYPCTLAGLHLRYREIPVSSCGTIPSIQAIPQTTQRRANRCRKHSAHRLHRALSVANS